MTIIAAMIESDDSLLIGSDSGGIESPGDIRLQNQSKLKRHSNASLVWGLAGNAAGIGHDFDPWLDNLACSKLDWNILRDLAIEKLSDLNRRQRNLIERAGVILGDEDLAVGLLVGWIGNPPKPGILELSEGGKPTFYTDDGFHAIGSGKPHGYIAHRTLQPIKGINTLQRFHHIVMIAAQMAQKSELPIQVLRVHRINGIEEANVIGESNAEQRT